MQEKFFGTRLETLLATKAFNDLTVDERKYVLSLLTEKEYLQYSLLLLNYKKALLANEGKIHPSPKILAILSQTFNNQHKQKRIFKLNGNYRLLAAVTVLLIIGVAIILTISNKKPSTEMAKINTKQPAINKALKVEPTGKDLANNIVVSSGKRKLPHVTEKVNNFLCLDIIPADSLAEMPCLNPFTTMIRVPGADDTEENASGS